MMFSIKRVIVALAAISSCNILFGESSIRSELDNINKHLDATVQSTELEENLKAIRELSNEKSKKGFHCNPFSKSCSKAAELLVSLEEVKCDDEYLNNLKRINDALENEAHKKDMPIRHISRVVHELSMKHAKVCQNCYYKSFESKTANQDQNLVKNVKILYDSLVDFELHYDLEPPCWIRIFTTVERLFSRIQSGMSCDWRTRRSEVLKALTLITEGSGSSEYIGKVDDKINGSKKVDTSKLRATYEKYLVDSCKYYIGQFGPEVFEPALYDAKLYHEVDESKPDFYFGMAYYKLCTKFLPSERDVFKNLLDEVKYRNNLNRKRIEVAKQLGLQRID